MRIIGWTVQNQKHINDGIMKNEVVLQAIIISTVAYIHKIAYK